MSMEPTAADASLSGHEWHKKQAGEGKELYIYPGKSLENLMAPKKKAEGQDVTLKLTAQDAAAFHRAADEVEYLCSKAATVFETLHQGIGSGFLANNERALTAILELRGRGMRHAEEHEGQTLGKLGMAFRDLGVSYSEEV